MVKYKKAKGFRCEIGWSMECNPETSKYKDIRFIDLNLKELFALEESLNDLDIVNKNEVNYMISKLIYRQLDLLFNQLDKIKGASFELRKIKNIILKKIMKYTQELTNAEIEVKNMNKDIKIDKEKFSKVTQCTDDLYNEGMSTEEFLNNICKEVDRLTRINEKVIEENKLMNTMKEKGENQMRKTNLNIYEIYIYLKNAPKFTFAKMSIKSDICEHDKILVMLNKKDNLVKVDGDKTHNETYLNDIYMFTNSRDIYSNINIFTVMQDYNQLEILGATFSIVEVELKPKEKWLPCRTVLGAIDKYNKGYSIRLLTSYNYDNDKCIHNNKYEIFDARYCNCSSIEEQIFSKWDKNNYDLIYFGNWSYLEK